MMDSSNIELCRFCMVPQQVMPPATLLLLILGIFHLSGETRSAPIEKSLTYIGIIKDESINRATEIHLSHCSHINISAISFGFEKPKYKYFCCTKCHYDVDCKNECCPNFVTDLAQPARGDGNKLECQNPATVTNNGSERNNWNAFCVLCHDLAKENLLTWDVSVNCINVVIFSPLLKERSIHIINTKEYDITLQAPEKFISPISSCNHTGIWYQYDEVIKTLYHSPHGSSFDKRYENVFCMICNSICPAYLDQCLRSGEPSDFSFNVLLNLRRQGQEHPESTQSPTRTVFDPYLTKCQPLHCSPRKTLHQGKCVSICSQINGVFFETEITFLPLERCRLTLARDVAWKIGAWLESLLSYLADSKHDVCKRDKVYKVNNNNTVVKDDYTETYSQNLNSAIAFVFSKWVFIMNGHYEFERIYAMINNMTKSTDSFPMGNNINFTFSPRLTRVFDIANLSIDSSPITFLADLLDCSLTNMSDLSKTDVSDGSMCIILLQNESGCSSANVSAFDPANQTYGSSHILFPNDLYANFLESLPSFPSILLCGRIDMDHINFSVKDFKSSALTCLILEAYMTMVPSLLIPGTMAEPDGQLLNWSCTEYGIYVPKSNFSLNITYFNVEYNFQGTASKICTHVYMPYLVVTGKIFQRHATFEANAIVSIFCTSVSLICLLLTLIVYIVFPELQTIPGKINMLLVFNLFMAQVMYIVFAFTPTSTGSICKGVGILLHFFWLSAIFWMHMCTFHMFKLFIKQRRPSPKTPNPKRVIIYTVIVIVSSLIFVLTNIIKTLVESDMVEMGYGSQICYISSGKMVGFTFALPVGLVVVSNLVMFCVVIFKLCSLPCVEMNVKHSRNKAVVLAKLSSLTGITWIFGFLYVWTEDIILSYIFIVLNASIGIFIMASFILNKRMIYLIRSKFSNKSIMNNLAE